VIGIPVAGRASTRRYLLGKLIAEMAARRCT
jgi:hypothetical protein